MKWTQQMVDDFNRKHAKKDEPSIVPPDAADKESLLHQQVLDECKRRRWICLHSAMHKRTFRNAGEYDCIILADRGIVFLVELKTKSGKLSEEQTAMHHWSRNLGHNPIVIRSMGEFTAIILATYAALSTKENQ